MSQAPKKPSFQKFLVTDDRPSSGWSCTVRAKTKEGALRAAARKYARDRLQRNPSGANDSFGK